ncbi:hypothetical protein PAXRUDRAFT_22032 [Paxillus rubicundulus Ve08.2h10]|uniref:Unplaced genomic scaffold scaffold_6051, whole genome shotgun sequence n=1 Tax=Paxillus rubicundulus Ve08.2h10 TaxID=930991 RepID=A0A0D0BL67_9AGAM|nr:hypothetical protein PAXRUDRAFT_22032 [Paxillus rubicundulus Ve08.2h10]
MPPMTPRTAPVLQYQQLSTATVPVESCRITLDLRARDAEKGSGLFLYFPVISRKQHLAVIHQNNMEQLDEREEKQTTAASVHNEDENIITNTN